MPKTSSGILSGQLAQAHKNRRKQIEKLRQLTKLKVTTIQGDVQYKVDFPLKQEGSAIAYSIKIDLPPSFPTEPPVLFVQPPCSHKYLDAAQLVVDFSPLENFKSKPDLATVVKRLILEFEKCPPIPLVLYDYEKQQQEELLRVYASQYPKLNENFAAAGSADVSAIAPSSSEQFYIGPKLPQVIPELENLTAEELKELDEDEVQLIGVLHSTEMAKQISKEREEISRRIEAIANENLSRSEHLENCREKLVKSFDKCQKMKEEYDKNVKKFSEASEWTLLHNLSLTLQVASAEQDQKDERLVESFLDGNTDVGEFTKEYVKSKTIAATRKVQEDKIQHILASQ